MAIRLRRKKLSGGKQSLYLDIVHEGRRNYEFLKLYLKPGQTELNRETLKVAEQIRAFRELDLQASVHGLIPAFKRKADLIRYFEKLGKEKESSGLYKNETAWWNSLQHLKDFTGGKVQFSAVNEHFLEDFKQYLLKHVSPNTASSYFAKLKNCLNQAVIDRILPNNPALHVSGIKSKETEKVFLSFGELKLLSLNIPDSNPGKEVARAFLFACFTGLRFSDVNVLVYRNIEDGCLKFRQQKTKDFEYLPLSQTAINLIGEIKKKDDATVFNLPSHQYCNLILKSWTVQAGVHKKIAFHTSRHTFAVLSLDSGIDIYTTSKLLGHKSLATTQVYATVTNKAKRRAVDSLPSLEI